jgi:asparagine synthase (glutamine-hydrolysing)
MCGICGKLMFDAEAKVPQALMKSMADTIRHRGPDDEGFYVSGHIGLGFRRLSIIDLSGGHQPLSNEDGSVWIVFNGEIYNYQELRTELIARGHIFRTRTDTEVIVHLYEEYSYECVQKLRGMFGFAIWDSRNRILFLSRDRVGIKPLYYYQGRNFLSFASEIKAVLADPAIHREIEPSAIDTFLSFYYTPGRQTLFRNLFKLEPGHSLRVQGNDVKTWRYWDLTYKPSGNHAHTNGLEHQLMELLDQTVQQHMISDVPIGFLLSGGVDSTAMLSLAAEKTDKPISSYTVGFQGHGIVDERPFARLAAKKYGSKHYEISISADEFAAFLPDYVWYMEEPVCEPPAIALYYVSKLARQNVKVLISGEGGDEAFAGYTTYRNLFWLERLKKMANPLTPAAGKTMNAVAHLTGSRLFAKYAPLFESNLERYYLSRTSTPFLPFNRDFARFYSPDFAQVINKQRSLDAVRKYLSNRSDWDCVDKMLYVDTKTWLPDDLLLKADKMTMANSLELRVPFLDHKVLEFAAQLPRSQKVRGRTTKYLAKKALTKRVPKEILGRKKAGFPVPYETWMRDQLRDWVSDILLDPKTVSRGYFQPSAVENLIRLNLASNIYPKEIFSLVVLELWHRAFLDQSYPLTERVGQASLSLA